MLARRKNGVGSHYMDSTALKERIYARTTPSPGANQGGAGQSGANPGDGTYARVYIGQEGQQNDDDNNNNNNNTNKELAGKEMFKSKKAEIFFEKGIKYISPLPKFYR